MKRSSAISTLALLGCLSVAGQQAQPTIPDPLVVTIDTQKTSDAVSKYVFGSFIEHIGTLIYRSIWAELLDDRKFYFPITSTDAQTPPPQSRNPLRQPLRKWRPVGPEDAVLMDTVQPFVGEHSPRILLDAATPRGIRQSGFSLLGGKQYTGHIYLRGTPGTKVSVTLSWGTGDSDKQIATFTLDRDYRKFPLSFNPKADSADAALEISGTGSGDFHIGAVSLMPADNMQGFRPDTIALLKQLHSGMWRLPGGNFLSDWDWHDAIGDPDKRRPMFDHAWNAMQVNDVGMDEFMTLCKLIGVEPYVTVNAGLGDAHSAAEEVEYLNGGANTYWGSIRAKNGHPEPYHIKYWDIGNEPWGTFQIGYTDLKYFVIKNNDFAREMRKADPEITLIGSAKMMEPMWLKGTDRAKYVDNIEPMFGSDSDWTGGLLEKCWGTFDGIAQHWYEGPGRHFDIAKAKALPIDAPDSAADVTYEPTTLEYARHAGDVIRRHAEEWLGYQKRFPKMVDKKIFLSMDEYAYINLGGGGGGFSGPTLKTALAYGMLLNETLRHTDSMTIGAHTMGTSSLDISPTASAVKAVGVLYELYGEHLPGTIPVAVSGNSPQPATNPNYGDEPRVRSGSPTYPLDVLATLTPDHRYLNLIIVNATEKDQKLDLNVAGSKLEDSGTLWKLTARSLDAVNRAGQPAQVVVEESPVRRAGNAITVAPVSVNVYRFPIAP